MRILIGVENNNEGRSLAWALEHFGCIGYGADGQTAVVAMAKAIPDYIAWLESHTQENWFNPKEIDIRLVEVVDDYFIDPTYQVVPDVGRLIKAWFKTDWKVLSQEDVEHAIKILTWAREDMLQLITAIPDRMLDESHPNEEMTIRQILGHIGRSEWWLMDRLGRSRPEGMLDQDPIERYQKERAELLVTLPDLIDLDQVVGKGGEMWSPRKVVRRLCWHERDHYQHIQKILGQAGSK